MVDRYYIIKVTYIIILLYKSVKSLKIYTYSYFQLSFLRRLFFSSFLIILSCFRLIQKLLLIYIRRIYFIVTFSCLAASYLSTLFVYFISYSMLFTKSRDNFSRKADIISIWFNLYTVKYRFVRYVWIVFKCTSVQFKCLY